MAAEMFSTITQLKSAVGGAVNQSFDLKSIEPYVELAARKHLTGWLSLDFYKELVTAHTGSPSAAETLLIPYVQKALAPLALFEYQPVGAVQFSDSGLYRTENEQHKTAYKYQEAAYKGQMLEMGYEAIESLLLYLYSVKADFATWTASEEYLKCRGIFLHDASSFRLAFSKYVSRYTYDMLRSLIEDVETFAIESTLPAQFFTELRTAHAANTANAKQKEAIRLIQKAVAHFVVEHAMTQNLLSVEGNRLIQREALEPQSYLREGTPTGGTFDVALQARNVWANRHMSRLKKLLTDNVADFPLCWDEASGGTNTDTDAWTIEEEATDPAPPSTVLDSDDLTNYNPYSKKMFRL